MIDLRPMRWLLVCCLLLGSLSGCRFNRLSADLERLHSVGALRGMVEVADWEGAPIVVVVIVKPERPGEPIHVVRRRTLAEPGRYAFALDPGAYIVLAFEDANRNEDLDDGERGAALETVTVVVRQRIDDHDVLIQEPLARRAPEDRPEILDERPFFVGEIGDLEDERFARRAGVDGVWAPVSMMEEHRPGLYFLEAYDADKTPVVFVHGMGGYAQEFRAIIDAVDRDRFQPWVYMYPSGMRIGVNAEFLSAALTEIRVNHAYERLCMVAHSMGGVVSRQALGHHIRNNSETPVRGFVTIASPLGGIASAEDGVAMAPEIVPAWHDLIPESGFMRTLYRTTLPESIEYHLLFTYEPRGPDDGVVPIQSQLRRDAQREAAVVRGFQTTHVGALSHARVIRQVKLALDRCRGDRPDAPLISDRRLDRVEPED